MTSYGENTAARILDEHAVITMAALDGNLEALTALVSLAAQTSYTDGMAASAQSLGFPL